MAGSSFNPGPVLDVWWEDAASEGNAWIRDPHPYTTLIVRSVGFLANLTTTHLTICGHAAGEIHSGDITIPRALITSMRILRGNTFRELKDVGKALNLILTEQEIPRKLFK